MAARFLDVIFTTFSTDYSRLTASVDGQLDAAERWAGLADKIHCCHRRIPLTRGTSAPSCKTKLTREEMPHTKKKIVSVSISILTVFHFHKVCHFYMQSSNSRTSTSGRIACFLNSISRSHSPSPALSKLVALQEDFIHAYETIFFPYLNKVILHNTLALDSIPPSNSPLPSIGTSRQSHFVATSVSVILTSLIIHHYPSNVR